MSIKDKILAYWFFRILPGIYFVYAVFMIISIALKKTPTFSDGIGISLSLFIILPVIGLWLIGNIVLDE